MPPRKRATPAPDEPAPLELLPTSVEGLAAFLVELLDHVTLRDAGEQRRLRSILTGEEVPADGDDEEEAEAGDGQG